MDSLRKPASIDVSKSITGKLGQDPILEEMQDGSVVSAQALGWAKLDLNPTFHTY